jgi:hypothetical protein
MGCGGRVPRARRDAPAAVYASRAHHWKTISDEYVMSWRSEWNTLQYFSCESATARRILS